MSPLHPLLSSMPVTLLLSILDTPSLDVRITKMSLLVEGMSEHERFGGKN
jgi:hypothetical protein